MKQFSQIKENYPRIALERFDNANLWIKYIILQIKKYLKDNILEVGAGCGSFAKSYMNNFKDILLVDSDNMNVKSLIEKFSHDRNHVSVTMCIIWKVFSALYGRLVLVLLYESSRRKPG